MAHHVPVSRGGFLHRGTNLLDRKLGTVDSVCRRGDTTAEHDLDVERAATQLLARRAAHLGHAVAHGAERGRSYVLVQQRASARANVGVSAGLPEPFATDTDARTVEEVL